MAIEIRCEHCDEWFRSPIHMSAEAFDTGTLSGNRVQCPHCKEMTGCDKENMRMRPDDDDPSGGGFVGRDT